MIANLFYLRANFKKYVTLLKSIDALKFCWIELRKKKSYRKQIVSFNGFAKGGKRSITRQVSPNQTLHFYSELMRYIFYSQNNLHFEVPTHHREYFFKKELQICFK